MSFHIGSKSRLNRKSAELFTSDSFFDEVARTACLAECLPRKELYESWAVARRVRKLCTGRRVVDLAAGHGMLGLLMLLLDDSSPRAVRVDIRKPESVAKLDAVFIERWPRLESRLDFVVSEIASFAIEANDLVVSNHACGALTDDVLQAAAAAGAAVAVLPCCHALGKLDGGGWQSWVDGRAAIDIERAVRLRERGYDVRTLTIPAKITPQHRLLIGIRA